MTHLKSGEAAERAGVHLETLRYYEKRGLLREPPRTEAGYRMYDETDVEDIRWIRQAQAIGFTLQEIGKLQALRAGEALPEDELRRYAEEKIAEIEANIERLRRMKALLESAAGRADASLASCPVLRAVNEGGRSNE
ncbi:MerR family transcriptional regulator [Paenibacillus antri]|uniref:MerR family transcriptional regulator n=1 Tax=Paenibacillus antri TaxID=2582848 RepID=A0A5R9GB37_9BACL|nr:MerR family transcriptional regulator [Paenibacillus antri]TLS53677.1 MerR family transcriptional regulator [Paenibacillus antri]